MKGDSYTRFKAKVITRDQHRQYILYLVSGIAPGAIKRSCIKAAVLLQSTGREQIRCPAAQDVKIRLQMTSAQG